MRPDVLPLDAIAESTGAFVRRQRVCGNAEGGVFHFRVLSPFLSNFGTLFSVSGSSLMAISIN